MRRLTIRLLTVLLVICCFEFCLSGTHVSCPSGKNLPEKKVALSVYSSKEEEPLANEVARNLEEKLPGLLSQASITGASVAVVDDRNIIWEQVYGHTGGEYVRPIDATTIFSIQSMSKSFTALAVMMAVQDGLIDLDAPLKRYLHDFTVNSIYDENPEEIITLRHLLAHRACFTHEAPFGSNYDDRNDFTKHIKSISRTWLRYPVGYRYAYSNLGIDLAGYILQVLSGKPFELYVKEKVFDALGMSSSSLDMEAIERIENRAVGHAKYCDAVPLRVPMIPAGGVYTNIRDMVKYLQFHINKGTVQGRRILRADLVEQMHEIQYARSDQRFGYCLGLIREPVSDSYGIYHAGGGYGFESIMVMYPEKKLGAILLTNSEGDNVIWQTRNLIKETILKQCGETPVQEPGVERMTELESGDSRVRAIMGRYGDEYSYVINFENNVLGIRTSRNKLYPVTFYDDGGELVGMFGDFSEVRFLPPFHGRRGAVMIIDRRLSNHNFHIIDFNDSPTDPPGPAYPHWAEYLGEYELLKNGDPLATFSVTVRNGYLYAAECKCKELDRGLFFTYDGQVIDFRSDPQSAMNILIRRKEAREAGR